MAKSPTQLNITVSPPKEIRFSGDFREMVVETLEIKNPTKDTLYFKVSIFDFSKHKVFQSTFQVKTTSPHRYVVKPHKGEIERKGEVKIAITLLPFLYKPDYSYRDKFLLQVSFTKYSDICDLSIILDMPKKSHEHGIPQERFLGNGQTG